MGNKTTKPKHVASAKENDVVPFNSSEVSERKLIKKESAESTRLVDAVKGNNQISSRQKKKEVVEAPKKKLAKGSSGLSDSDEEEPSPPKEVPKKTSPLNKIKRKSKSKKKSQSEEEIVPQRAIVSAKVLAPIDLKGLKAVDMPRPAAKEIQEHVIPVPAPVVAESPPVAIRPETPLAVNSAPVLQRVQSDLDLDDVNDELFSQQDNMILAPVRKIPTKAVEVRQPVVVIEKAPAPVQKNTNERLVIDDIDEDIMNEILHES